MLKHLPLAAYQLSLLLLPAALSAQQLFNGSHSNYSGLDGVAWNPATLADNRYRVQFQLVAVDAHATNNAYRYTGPWSPRQASTSFQLTDSEPIGARSQPKLFSAGVNVRGPGLLVRLGPKQGVAFGTRVRTAIQGNGISRDVLHDAMDAYQYRTTSTGNRLNANLNAFAEWDVSYGRVLYDQGPHFLKAGLTVKRLIGISSVYVQGTDIDYEVGSRRYPDSDTTLRIQRFNGAFGYANPTAYSQVDGATALRWLTTGQAPGSGWGADVGIVYEFRPNPADYSSRAHPERADYRRNKYRLRLAASLTDLGAIAYRHDATAYNGLALRNAGVHNKELNDITWTNYIARSEAILHTKGQAKETQFTSGLPTALNVDVDYHVAGPFYVNASVSQGLRGRDAIGMRQFSYAAFTPRLETKWVDVAAGVSQTNDYQLLAYNLLVRLGPLTLGTNNLLGLLADSHPYGANAYAEVSLLTLTNKRPRTETKPKRIKRAPRAN